jgi:tellurite resistance protein
MFINKQEVKMNKKKEVMEKVVDLMAAVASYVGYADGKFSEPEKEMALNKYRLEGYLQELGFSEDEIDADGLQKSLQDSIDKSSCDDREKILSNIPALINELKSYDEFSEDELMGKTSRELLKISETLEGFELPYDLDPDDLCEEWDDEKWEEYTDNEKQSNIQFDIERLANEILKYNVSHNLAQVIMYYAVKISMADKGLFAFKSISKPEMMALEELSESFSVNIEDTISSVKFDAMMEKRRKKMFKKMLR